MNSFLCFVTGLDREALSRCSSTERNAYAGIAFGMLIPIFTGAIAAALVSDYFTDSKPIKVIIVISWVAIIWLVERIIIHSLHPGKLGWLGWSRILLAVCLGVVVSTMMSLVIFKDRIDMELNRLCQDDVKKIERDYENRIEGLRKDMERYQQRYETIQNELARETQGLSGSGHYGNGPAAKQLGENLKDAKRDRDSKQIEFKSVAAETKSVKENQIKEVQNRYSHAGLITSLETLNKLSLKHPLTIGATRLLISLILILLETIPLLSVCGKKKAEYHIISEHIQDANLKLQKQRIDQVQELLWLKNNFACEMAKQLLEEEYLQDKLHHIVANYSRKTNAVYEAQKIHLQRPAENNSSMDNQFLEQLHEKAIESIKMDSIN